MTPATPRPHSPLRAAASPLRAAASPLRVAAATLGATVCAALVLATGAHADLAPPVNLPGSPVSVWVGPEGQLQGMRATAADPGQTNGIFYPPDDHLGNAGLFLAFPPQMGNPTWTSGTTWGFHGDEGPDDIHDYIPTDTPAGPATGSGTADDPYKQVTTYFVEPNIGAPGQIEGDPSVTAASITQTTTYVTGSDLIGVRWDVTNTTSGPIAYKALVGADFYFEGSDEGVGIATPGPPRFLGGANSDTGRSGGFQEVLGDGGTAFTPWSEYEEMPWGTSDPGTIWPLIQDAGNDGSPVFDNSIVTQSVDNAGGVEWDDSATPGTALPAGETRSYAIKIRSAQPAALVLTPATQSAPQNTPITFTATAKDTSDQPYAGKVLRFAIAGSNPRTGSAAIGADGTAQITDPGSAIGQDVLTAFVDLNNNGTRDPTEPLATSKATFADLTAPKCTAAIPAQQPGGPGIGKAVLVQLTCDSLGTVATSGSLAIPVTTTTKPPKHSKKKPTTKTVIKTYPLVPSSSPLTAANAATVVGAKVPAGVAKKFAKQLVTATVSIVAKDPSNNSMTIKVVKKLRLAKYATAVKKKKKKK